MCAEPQRFQSNEIQDPCRLIRSTQHKVSCTLMTCLGPSGTFSTNQAQSGTNTSRDKQYKCSWNQYEGLCKRIKLLPCLHGSASFLLFVCSCGFGEESIDLQEIWGLEIAEMSENSFKYFKKREGISGRSLYI